MGILYFLSFAFINHCNYKDTFEINMDNELFLN